MILVVEDEKDIRDVMAEILTTEGYEVRCAANGQEALDVLRSPSAPCLVLLDLMMPVMDGHEFLKIRGKDKALASIPVVVVSAVADRSKVVGAREFIRKPIDLNLLLDTAQTYCSIAR